MSRADRRLWKKMIYWREWAGDPFRTEKAPGPSLKRLRLQSERPDEIIRNQVYQIVEQG